VVMSVIRKSPSFPQRLSLWLSSKSPSKPSITLTQKNIYIVPTLQGFGFMLILVLMLVTAINYQSSLVYLFTFFLVSVFFISIWMCFLNLLGLTVTAGKQHEVFVGEPCGVAIKGFHASKALYGLRFSIEPDLVEPVEIEPGRVAEFVVNMARQRRGLAKFDRMRVETTFPFGLIIAWSWLRLNASILVYPKPIEPAQERSGGMNTSSNEGRLSEGDPESLRAYRAGESMSRIVWKKLAAKDELVVRDPVPLARDDSWLQWDDYPEVSSELRLSYLAYDVLQHSTQGIVFGLEIPGARIEPDLGAVHRRQCLEALALF